MLSQMRNSSTRPSEWFKCKKCFSGTAELIAAAIHKKIVASKETVHQKTTSLSLTLPILGTHNLKIPSLNSTDGTRRLIRRQQRESDQQKIKILFPFQRIWLMKIRLIIALMQTTYAVVKFKPEKNSGLNGIRAHDLCDTGAVLYINWAIKTTGSWSGYVFVTYSYVKNISGYIKVHTFQLRRMIRRYDWLSQLWAQLKVAEHNFRARSCWCDSARAQRLQIQTCRWYTDHSICSMPALSLLFSS